MKAPLTGGSLFLIIIMMIFPNDPINVSLGDPIVDLEIVSLDDREAKAENFLDTGFLIFLSLNCSECLKAIEVYEKLIHENFDSLILLDESSREEVHTYFPKYLEKIYFTNSEDLERLNIKTFPALLGYKNSKLKTAFHGPLTEKNLLMILNHFNN